MGFPVNFPLNQSIDHGYTTIVTIYDNFADKNAQF